MTKEQYEGTPELIFYCEYDPNDFDDRLEIPFTNEYDVQVIFSRNKYKIHISISLTYEKSGIPKNFFGNNILNITAIAGKNGSGKTSIFKQIGLLNGHANRECLVVYLVSKTEAIIEARNLNELVVTIFLDNSNLIHNGSTSYNQMVAYDNVELLFLGHKLSDHENAVFRRGSFNRKQILYSNSTFYETLTRNKTFKQAFNFLSQKMLISFPRVSSLIIFDEFRVKIHQWLTLYYENEKRISFKFLYLLHLCQYLFKSPLNHFKSFSLMIKNNENLEDHKSLIFYQQKLISLFNTESSFVFVTNSIEEILLSIDDLVVYENATLNIKSFIRKAIDCFNCIPIWHFHIHSEWALTIEMTYWDETIFNFIKHWEIFEKEENFFIEYDFGTYSTGERELLVQTSTILSSIVHNSKSEDKTFTNIIFLDEYEKFLHPEWMRSYLQYMVDFFDKSTICSNVQFIINTHSPYLLSDLPKENIILIEKDKETGKRAVKKSNYGFASNYYDIMSDNFFLDDTIGEFAKQKINDCIQAINHISDDLDKLANDELILQDGLSLFVEDSLKTIEEQNKIINLVGDKFIQKQLQQLSDSVKQRLLANADHAVRKQKIEQDIAELEEKLRQKKMELNND